MNSLDIDKPEKETRVIVAMSGGVDSSVAAAILKEEGYDVVGITLQLYEGDAGPRRPGACCAGQDIYDARRVAEALDIPHYVLDYEARFREAVIDPFAESYLAGETPIPCIACNQTVKFTDLLATARDLDADALATGHYIESRRDGARRSLHRPWDLARDQSYFLYGTTREQLSLLRFPLARLTKDETRAVAERLGLIVADKPDSQDICFVAKGRYSDLIRKLRPEADQPGDIVHVDGRHLGRHRGIVDFTVGQRRGIGVATGEPLYVVELDAEAARVVVGPKSALRTCALTLRATNWLARDPIERYAEEAREVFVRVRSTRPPRSATIVSAEPFVVELAEGEEGVAAGQACVIYDGEGIGAELLGGGVIAATDAARHAERAADATGSADHDPAPLTAS